jgi:tripartite-type tricarboxylate transporter receptor subunit TctC
LPRFALAAPAAAQSADGGAFPSRPARLVVPFPPGASPNDITGHRSRRQLARDVGIKAE